MDPSGEGPEVALEVEACILKGEGAGPGPGVTTDRDRNQLLLEAGEIPAEVPDPGAEQVSEKPVLHREIGSSPGFLVGGFCLGVIMSALSMRT